MAGTSFSDVSVMKVLKGANAGIMLGDHASHHLFRPRFAAGAGSTGIGMAGMIIELARTILARETLACHLFHQGNS